MFVFAKLLSFLPFGNLFRGTSGKIILYGVIAIAIGYCLWWVRDEIRDGALSDFNRQQTIIINQQNQKAYSDLEDIVAEQDKLISKLNSERTELLKGFNDVRVQIASNGTETPANQALKDAISGLSVIQSSLPRRKPNVEDNEDSNSYLTKWRESLLGK